ncbi:MAG: tRNA pseudouridine synthase B [Verrucomicrobia subdivision 3 bacterium]|nr:tRNA pseudouridine synthase B [Limisphaerales bacterium]MCS1412958.1 tRNA pseudouridine synthase B [Limisphaerales bacterium]
MTDIDGALLIDKGTGWTSHDIVARVRSHCKVKKVGHCGALDPNAIGLLVVVLGKATKLSERLMEQDKFYEGIVRFGETTDSYDADGNITATSPVPPMTLESLNEEAKAFVGDILQEPPMISAIKVDGVPLYKLARKGKTVERKPRLVHIYRYKFTDYMKPDGTFKIACTKGTYVRSLAHELGANLGCGAHLKQLRRTRSGSFDVAQALTIDAITKMSPAQLAKHVIPIPELTRPQ